MKSSDAMRLTRQGIQQVFDLVYPPRCAGCKRSGYVLCPACLAQIQPLTSACQRCSAPITPGGQCSFCRPGPGVQQLGSLRAVSTYREPLRSFIHALKYDGNTRLAQPLGMLLVHEFRMLGIHADAIVPVPLHAERYKQRGYNHAALLARVLATQTGLPMLEDMLVRHRATLAQVGLERWERRQNVLGAFSCAPAYTGGQLLGRTIMLIDDVCTTRATLEACAAPLVAAGAAVVYGLVLARPAT